MTLCPLCTKRPAYHGNPYCSICTYELSKGSRPKKEKKRYEIPKMSEKKKRREQELSQVRTALKGKVRHCETCSSPYNLTYSHIIPVSQHPELEAHPDNALIQCMSCHSDYEHSLEKKQQQRTWPKCVAVMARLCPQYYNKLMSKLT